MKIGITGGDGFIGWHLRAYLASLNAEPPLIADRAVFADREKLTEFVRSSDAIVHLAAATRGDEAAVYETNIRLTEDLIEALEEAGKAIPVVFSSTIQVERDTAYGRSKRENAEALRRWADRAGAHVAVLVIPNVFGEFARPYHNTVVATFATEIIERRESTVDREVSVRLLHVQRVVERLYDALTRGMSGTLTLDEGDTVTVGYLYETLAAQCEHYRQGRLPTSGSELERRLFNTLRSYLPDDFYPRAFEAQADDRGALFEPGDGHVFISTTKPGRVRGDHWHRRKFERFCVVEGTAEMRVRKLFEAQTTTYALDGSKPQFVDTKTFYVHNLVNTGTTDLKTVFIASEQYNETDPDTFREIV